MHLGPLGQLAVAPLVGGDANVNLLLSVAGLERLGHRGPEALLHDALAGAPGLRHRGGQAHLTQVMTTPDLPQGSRSVVGPGLALVGDAAGFCDPFTGEGMTLALRGATLLAAAVIAENLDHYAVSYRATIGRRHHLGSWLTKAIDRPWLADVVVAVVSRIPPLTRRLVQDAAGG